MNGGMRGQISLGATPAKAPMRFGFLESAGAWFRSASRSKFAYPLLGIAALGYGLVALELSLAHALPMPEPFLRISDSSYFFWGTFFYAPVIVMAWFLASGAIYLMTRGLRVSTRFDQLLKTIAFASGLGTLGTLVPDLVTSPLRAAGVISEKAWEASIGSASGFWFGFTWVFLVIYVALFAVGYPLAVRQVTGLGRWKSTAIGLGGFVVFQGFEIVFIR